MEGISSKIVVNFISESTSDYDEKFFWCLFFELYE